MIRTKIKELVEALDAEIERVSDIAKKTKQAAQEIAKAAAASPSQSGDREHSKNQAEIAKDFLTELKHARTQIFKETDVPTNVEGTCYLELSFDDGRGENYYFIEKPFKLDSFKFISHDSPLGKELVGKVVNAHFKLDDPPLSGIIKLIG